MQPADLAALVPSPSEPVCDIFIKFRKFQILFWRWWRYLYKDDLELSDAFITEACYAKRNYCSGALLDPTHIINTGARDVATIPPTPSELKALIPTLGSPFCEAFVPNMINWMQRVSDAVAHQYSETTEFTPEFIAKLCALDCISSGGGGGGVGGTCPTVTVTGTATSRNATLDLSFTAYGATTGYDYELFRRAAPGDPWVSITTGTTVGNIVTYSDTGLTNDQVYYYKLEVQKSGCDLYSGEVSGTPTLCAVYNIGVTVVSNAAGQFTATISDLDGRVENGATWSIYAAPVGAAPGVLVGSGTWGTDNYCTPNGRGGVCFTGNVPQYAGVECIITATLQNGSCTLFQATAQVLISYGSLQAPTIAFGSGIVSWNPVAGATGYEVWARPLISGDCVGSPLLNPSWVKKFDIPSNGPGRPVSFPVVMPYFPVCRRINSTNIGYRMYEVYVLAVNESQRSPNSNTVGTNVFVPGGACGQ